MKLSEKLVSLRKSSGMSQGSLADHLDISRQAVSRWETGAAKPDADHILKLSKLFGVTADYLLDDGHEGDRDLPKIREKDQILRTNLTLIAIIAQAAFLNAAMRPFQTAQDVLEFTIKSIPLLASSIWMAFNLRYETDPAQYRKNVKIELVYCAIQASIALFGHYSRLYPAGTALLITVALIYIFKINPSYMNRRLIGQKRRA